MAIPATSFTYPTTSMFSVARIFLASAPAATRDTVSRPDARPAPHQSAYAPYFTRNVYSA